MALIKTKLQVVTFNGFGLLEGIAYGLQVCRFWMAVMTWVRRRPVASISIDWRCPGWTWRRPGV